MPKKKQLEQPLIKIEEVVVEPVVLAIEVVEEVLVVKKPKKKYFDQDTEDSIVKFQQEPDIEIKKIIFVKEIRPAFSKLIENVIFVYKFYTLRRCRSA